MREQREALKTYFENGDRPTQTQFAQLIDSYVHLNELNFGLKLRSSGTLKAKFYHFYDANEPFSAEAHKTIEAPAGSKAEVIPGYTHLFSRIIQYKELVCEIEGAVDLVKHQPKIIIERYKQKKKLASGYIKPAGFYKELTFDAALWNRKSEYDVTSREMTLDLGPVHYFKPGASFRDFRPSGSIRRSGSFKYSRHGKSYVPIQMKLQITIDNTNYTSHPIDLKIVMGSGEETDAINFAFD
ncbi:hypothetical protein GCM10011344_05700 [Dokdonia pacifica]|uniref:Uncharacterized protein n=1 Tax=Dokdonia pacifica TaxID=1627892 RepID=A0A238ZQM5_9FLAO|nr:hypothetical protein [Dokdonia pacifica]GGG07971.1 hypothetical protein GCM10011344_05700 [Dokdonia pacifica]SNR85640.1 hypothetical protein SAMN06265376_103438 [Dokdonia pacifica]